MRNLTPVLPEVFGLKSGYRVKKEESWKYERTETGATPTQIENARQARRWLYVVPCKFGHLFSHSETRLGYSGKGSVRLKALMAVTGVVLGQHGNVEFSVNFSVSRLSDVGPIVMPRRKRVMSAEQKARMRVQLSSTTIRLARQNSPFGGQIQAIVEKS